MNSNERHSFNALFSYNLRLFARLLSTKNQIEMELFLVGATISMQVSAKQITFKSVRLWFRGWFGTFYIGFSMLPFCAKIF